jgi:hypothetical protein
MALKHGVFSPEIPVPFTRQDYLLSLFYGCLCTAFIVYIQTILPGKMEVGYCFSAVQRTVS